MGHVCDTSSGHVKYLCQIIFKSHYAYRSYGSDKNRFLRSGLTGGFLLLRIFSFAISVNPHVCFISDFILISMFLR